MEKIWMVIGDFGDWDTAGRINLRCFSTFCLAQKYKDDLEKSPIIAEYKELYQKWLYGGEEDDDGKITLPLTTPEKERFELMRKWKFDETSEYYRLPLEEFNCCFIETYQVF